ncbi:MAG: hypothetical protein ABR999_01165 [Methanoregula sp.]|jgi:large-conductance mechanosensitive channel|uniref:hypothetical protein n=1 Tax=Methanoregula sp. TaxID=2052170 RepID=UPI003D0EF8E0
MIKDPSKICLIYLAPGVLWIVYSDWLFFLLVPQEERYAMIQMVKGVLSIIITAFILFLLIRYNTHRLQEKNEELRVANARLRAGKEELNAQNKDLVQSLPSCVILVPAQCMT